MKNGVAYKTQNVYLKININLKQASTLPFRPVLLYIETSQLIYGANQWDGFYATEALDWNKLILTITTFSIYYFLLSWKIPLSFL